MAGLSVAIHTDRGKINLTLHDRHRCEAFKALTPYQARMLAEKLLNAASMAEMNESQWKPWF